MHLIQGPPPKKKQQPWLLLFFLAHGWFNCFAISSSSLKCPGSCCFREACSISKSIHQATKSSSLLIWMDFKARCSPLLLFFSWLNSLPCHEIMINISIYIYHSVFLRGLSFPCDLAHSAVFAEENHYRPLKFRNHRTLMIGIQ